MNLDDYYAQRFVAFVKENAPYVMDTIKKHGEGNANQTLRNIILKHLKFNTLVALWYNNEIVAMSTFNIEENTAFVIHTIVHPDYRGKKLLHALVQQAYLRYPYLKKLQFKRHKYMSDKVHTIKIDKFLRGIK
jgi:predicted GNAT family acetyltransferase